MRRRSDTPSDLQSRALMVLVGILAAVLLWNLGAMAGTAWLSTIARPAPVGGPFALIDQYGLPVSSADLSGKPVLLFFGRMRSESYRRISTVVENTVERLGPAAVQRINVIFITLDPAHDTPAAIKDYVANSSIKVIALTGAADQIAAVARAYDILLPMPQEQGSESDHIDDSPMLYLLDKRGRLVVRFSRQADSDTVARSLAALL